ncbi:MAG: hypothetical protein H0T56_15540 [Pseudaminobacter sp.]|nr:hypothetical protein [Pseudaminobacter sp.]
MAMADTPSGLTQIAPITTDDSSYVDWPAIFAGTALASAISFVLLAFGSALGLSFADVNDGTRSGSLFWFALAAALWMLWVQISSYFAGGYLVGRMRRRKNDATEHESDIRDGSHGLTVWAVGVVFSGLVALSGVASLAATAANSASTIAAGAASGEGDEGAAGGIYNLSVDRFLRGNATETPLPEGTRDEVGRVIVASLGEGAMNDADRQYLTSLTAARAGIDEPAAQQRVDALYAEAQAAQAQALEAADTARKATLVGAFLTAAALLISAVAAYFGATLGGKHRDQQTVVEGWYKAW